MPLVKIPAVLRDYTGGTTELAVPAHTVGGALQTLSTQYPQLRRHLYTERGELRSYVNVFVNEDDVRTLNGLETPVRTDDTVLIVPSIAGG